MSWSVNVMGQGKNVGTKVARDLDAFKCTEPEESIKQLAKQIIVQACDATPEKGIKIQAYGSMSWSNEKPYGQNLNIQIDCFDFAPEPSAS